MKSVSLAQRGHDVQVNVVDDPRARDPAQVPAEVVPLRRVDLGQRRQSALRQAVHLERLVVPKLGQLIRMAVRRDHQMPRRVRESVQQHERVIAPVDDESQCSHGDNYRVVSVHVLPDLSGRWRRIA